MEEEEILDVIRDKGNGWTFSQIGLFVWIALTEDKMQEDIEEEIGIRRAK